MIEIEVTQFNSPYRLLGEKRRKLVYSTHFTNIELHAPGTGLGIDL